MVMKINEQQTMIDLGLQLEFIFIVNYFFQLFI